MRRAQREGRVELKLDQSGSVRKHASPQSVLSDNALRAQAVPVRSRQWILAMSAVRLHASSQISKHLPKVSCQQNCPVGCGHYAFPLKPGTDAQPSAKSFGRNLRSSLCEAIPKSHCYGLLTSSAWKYGRGR